MTTVDLFLPDVIDVRVYRRFTVDLPCVLRLLKRLPGKTVKVLGDKGWLDGLAFDLSLSKFEVLCMLSK